MLGTLGSLTLVFVVILLAAFSELLYEVGRRRLTEVFVGVGVSSRRSPAAGISSVVLVVGILQKFRKTMRLGFREVVNPAGLLKQ